MRYVLVAILAIALFAAGFLVATMVQSDADAQGTWQYEVAIDGTELSQFLGGLPSDCTVDLEAVFTGSSVIFPVAYSCPD